MVRLRPAKARDEAFLLEVYASTREEELKVTGWTPEQKHEFCLMQGQAQLAHYRRHYPSASYEVIEVGGTPVGRLFVDRWPAEIRIMDIALLSRHRGRGTGTWLLERLRAEAKASSKKLSIHVERMNPALRLYFRLGFGLAEDKGVYYLMEWLPR